MSMSKRTIHLVPQFHHDIEYLLPMEPYLEICYDHLRTAHRMLSRRPDYAFVVEQVFLMERFFAEYPSFAEAFRRHAAEGRLELAPGMYTTCDFNMPSGESFFRQALVGRRWCEANLGCVSRVMNASDCTGSTAQLPQMAKLCGYEYIVFERAVDDASRMSEILWRGLDGAETPTVWLPGGYAGWRPNGNHDERETLVEAATTALHQSLSENVVLAHGGDFRRPYERGPAILEWWNREHPSTPAEYATYCRALDAVDWTKAVLHTGEWNPDRQGCYSSRIRVKQLNRACETLLTSCETMQVAADLFLGIPPDEESLLRAWKLAFLNQFHDVLWGTVSDDVYRRVLERAKCALMIGHGLAESRLDALLRAAGGAGADGNQAIVFNPLPWRREVCVEISPSRTAGLALQAVDETDDDASPIVVKLDLPACGYRIVDLPDLSSPPATAGADAPFEVTPRTDESGRPSWHVTSPLYEMTISGSGVIQSLTRRKDGLEVVDPARPWFNAICLQSDRGNLWQYYEGPLSDGGPHGLESDLVPDPYPLSYRMSRTGKRIVEMVIDNRVGPPARVRVIQATPRRLVLGIRHELSARWPRFRHFAQCGVQVAVEQRVILYDDAPRIDFQLRTHHLKGRWYRMRAAFFTDIRDGRILHEIPFGRFQRPEGEFAAQNYVAYVGKNKGLALFNRGLPGNNVTDGVMMLSLMRSVNIGERVDSDMGFEEGEQHTFDYAILPFAGEAELSSLSLARQGLEFIAPPYVYAGGGEPECAETDQTVPERLELLQVDPPAIACTAVTPDNGRIVVRLYESEGTAVTGTLRINFPFEVIEQCDAMLGGGAALRRHEGVVHLDFRPFEIKTLVIHPHRSAPR